MEKEYITIKKQGDISIKAPKKIDEEKETKKAESKRINIAN